MSVMLGVLGDSYRRQLRKPQDRPPVDIIIDKVSAVADEIGTRPFGVDFGVGGCKHRRRLSRRSAGTAGRAWPRADGHCRLVESPCGQRSLRTAAGESDRESRGRPPPWLAAGSLLFGYGGRVNRDGRIRLAVEQVGRLADAAAEYGMIVTTENYDYFTSDDFLEIFQRLDRPNVGLHNDTGNWLLLTKTHSRRREGRAVHLSRTRA